MSVPSSKMAVTTDSPGTDEDRSVLIRLTPLRADSTETVTSCSTSSVESPGASVCTTICGGANSGNTSHGASRTLCKPPITSTTASSSTTSRNSSEKWIRRLSISVVVLYLNLILELFAIEYLRSHDDHLLAFLDASLDRDRVAIAEA